MKQKWGPKSELTKAKNWKERAEREREEQKKGIENKRKIQAKALTVRDLHCAAV